MARTEADADDDGRYGVPQRPHVRDRVKDANLRNLSVRLACLASHNTDSNPSKQLPLSASK
jgi:hypothetical protein